MVTLTLTLSPRVQHWPKTKVTLCCARCRLRQLIEWLEGAAGGDCLIVLDECHKAKNLLVLNKGEEELTFFPTSRKSRILCLS